MRGKFIPQRIEGREYVNVSLVQAHRSDRGIRISFGSLQQHLHEWRLGFESEEKRTRSRNKADLRRGGGDPVRLSD